MKTVVNIHSLTELNEFAIGIAPKMRPGAIVRLDGTLGAGKTHFVKALGAALGYPGDISSPTFPLVHEYRWKDQELIHIDFYRLETEDEVLSAGLGEHLPGEGITVVEWACRFPNVFPPDCWQITLAILDENSREVTIESPDY